MFGRRAHGDVKKSAGKVLDPKKDTVTRLKHLRIVLDSYDSYEAKTFFEANYSHIYYIFYDFFINVETDLRQRANKAHREELDVVLFIFEKILTLLPELIHKRWQYHSIGRLMKKLLHTGNSLKLRREGMRLFVIWYQILMDNATEECHRTYASLVPKLSSDDVVDMDVFTVRSDNRVSVVEILPMLPPQSGEKTPDNITKWLLEALLTCMVSEVTKVEWSNKEMHEFSFNFLFNRFKEHYLLNIFPEFSANTNIYRPCLDMPESRTLEDVRSTERSPSLALCQEVVVKWVAIFTQSFKKRDPQPASGEKTRGDDHVEGPSETSPGEGPTPGSNTSTLSTTSAYTEKDCSSSVCSDDHSINEYEIVKNVLYSSRENVNIIHEIFRQALLFPFEHSSAMRRVINVYKDWFQEDHRPVFMQEAPSSCPSIASNSPNPPHVSHVVSDDVHPEASPSKSNSNSTPMTGSGRVRQDSYMNACHEDTTDSIDGSQVRAGVQNILQVFITHAGNVFLLQSSEESNLLDEQVDMCKRVLNIYRYMVMNHHMDQKTWEQLLLVLLRITSGVLSEEPPSSRHHSRGGRLAQALFQTLIVTWIKANLNVYVSSELWDRFLKVLSSLTQWVELIKEWAKTMDTLTRVLARQVYNLDLADLPLDRLSEQKEKRRRGTRPPVTSISSDTKSPPSQPGDLASNPDLSRQRSLSGEVMPAHTRLTVTKDNPGTLLRSSSDTSLIVRDPALDKKGSSYSSEAGELATEGNRQPGETASLNEDMLGMYFSASEDMDTESTTLTSDSSMGMHGRSHQAHEVISMLGLSGEEQEVVSVSASLASTVTDSTSMASVDSGSAQYASLETQHSGSSISAASLGAVPYSSLDHSGDSNYQLSDPSDSDPHTHLSSSRSPSPSGLNHRPQSPGHLTNGHLGDDEGDGGGVGERRNGVEVGGKVWGKDSPTPDRESIHLDDNPVAALHENCPVNNGESKLLEPSEDIRSVLAGGVVVGWTADVAVVLWRRMLGSLGDVNTIKDPEIHAHIYEYLCDLMAILLKMRDNLSVTKDNQFSPPPPELLPPVMAFIPWLFQALELPAEYKAGRLLAYRLLCMATVRRDDMQLPCEHMCCFYRVLHQGLVHADQDTTNVLVRHCGPRFFSLPLVGSTMLILDFVHAANTIAASTDLREAPRAEAVSILGSLLCFPNHFGEMPVLQPNSVDMTIMHCTDVKDHIISMLLKSGKKEPAGLARCIAISSLGIFLYEELSHDSLHPRLKEAINVLLATIKFNNKLVAQVATDMLVLLCDHVDTLLQKQDDLPRRIIEAIVNAISVLLPMTENSNAEEDRRLLVSIMFCLLEWCMRVPIGLLLDTAGGHKSLIYKVFKVLNTVVTGTQGTLTPRGSVPFADFMVPEDDLENLRENPTSSTTSPRTPLDVLPDYAARSRRTQNGQEQGGTERDILKLASRTVMGHLVNHLGHFPMGGGAAKLNSTVQEHHDISQMSLAELSPEIFRAPNVQFFVVNNSTLISFVELPALLGIPGGGVTAGLTTGKTVTRVILRDTAGKFCWDSTVLYGPPRCRAGSYPAAPQPYNPIPVVEDIDQIGGSTVETDVSENDYKGSVSPARRKPHELPTFSNTRENFDNLNDLLQYIGHASPECQLYPGEALNVPFHPPDEIAAPTEETVRESVCEQQDDETAYFNKHKNDNSMLARALEPVDNCETSSPFQLCRLFLNQLGFLQWGKRTQFDLLRKTDRLLREIKHLDTQKCRETHKIAVIYVAEGQEDKQSILSNTVGSKAYEDFVAGLGWEVDLESHSGFMGGLQHNKSTGLSAPYYATSTQEIVYHVSTRMPADTTEDKHRKLRHLGNDEVQIVWSEHTRDYRRGIIPTEFGDVLIIIYPLQNGLFRIHINRKPEVPYFGPLFDGAIVGSGILPRLVRATAINAGHVMRSLKPYYQSFYEERARYVQTIVQEHREETTFEEFSASVYAPVLPPGVLEQGSGLPAGHSGILQGSIDTDSPSNTPTTNAEHESRSDSNSAEKQSPQASSKTAKDGSTSDSASSSFHRRLSFGKSKKSVTKQALAAAQAQPLATPPDSPIQPIKIKK